MPDIPADLVHPDPMPTIELILPKRDAPNELPADDQTALESAYLKLERISYAARLTGLLGRQIELAGSMVPAVARRVANYAAEKALRAAMHVALRSLGRSPSPSPSLLQDDGAVKRLTSGRASSSRIHRTLAAASGATGGALGLASLPLELPISTVILLRAIADIAWQEGEDPANPETALACMQVFALGGPTSSDNSMDNGYFAIRALLARSISDAAKYVTASGVAIESAPALVRLFSQLSARFGLIVSQKAAAQAVPIIGAIGGAAVNFAFMEHFQKLAEGHFTIRRLERTYGAERVRTCYEAIRAKGAGA